MLLSFFQDFIGGRAVFTMAANCFIADITTPETRTKRMSLLNGLSPVGSNIGKALSGMIKSNLGLMYNFIIGLTVTLISTLYVLLFVTDSQELVRERNIALGMSPGIYTFFKKFSIKHLV